MGEFSNYFEQFPDEDPANWNSNPQQRAELERLRIAQEKLDEAMLRKQISFAKPPPPEPKA